MQDWIAGAMAVLGTVLVLGGFAVVVLRGMDGGTPPARAGVNPPVAGDEATTVLQPVSKPSVVTRFAQAVRRMPEADRLIAWGILLLLLGAIAAGAISFEFGANAGTN